MGSNRDIAFVKQVYRATVEDFMIPAPGTDKERGGKHGRKNLKQAQLAELSDSFITQALAKQWRNRQEIDRDEGAGFWDGAESKLVCKVEKILEKRARENAGAHANIARNGDICGILVDLTVCTPFPCISHLV